MTWCSSFEGRFYLVDWKSNLLGSRIEDYGAAALAGEIRRRHYYFQYQLYTVALDRYLRLRLPGYRYEQHFGGVYYLFLRGIDPARPSSAFIATGWQEPLVRALSGAADRRGDGRTGLMPEIHQLIGSSAFSDLDRHFAAFIEAQAGGDAPSVGAGGGPGKPLAQRGAYLPGPGGDRRDGVPGQARRGT